MSLRLSVEVVGAFVFTWGERILLAGRSQGFLPEVFSSSLELNSSDFYFFHLEYWADPLLSGAHEKQRNGTKAGKD